MNEPELADAWVALEPTAGRRRRLEARVWGWLDARESSLAAEWLGLVKGNPIAGFGLATAAACLVLIATPLSWVGFAIF